MKKNGQYEFNIETTEFPAMGVAFYEDKKVKIKNALPGQKVIARISKKRKSKIEGKIIEILEDVDYKIQPECSVFGTCGGCSHQNVPYNKQLELKKEQVLKLFENANISEFDFEGIEESPETFEYRNKMEFTFGDFEKGGELSLGMHAKGMSYSIVTVDDCRIIDVDFRKILKTVLDYLKDKNLSHYRVMQHEGYLRTLVIRKGINTGEILINIVTTSQVDFNFDEMTEILKNAEFEGKLTGVLHTINDSLSDIVQADEMRILYGREYIYEELLGLKFKINPFAFFQTNSKGAEKLYSIVRDYMGDSNSKTVFDLYCGTGTIGQIAAPKAKKVIGIELIEEAVKAAWENASLNGLDNCEFIAGDIKDTIKQVKETPDIIILDPPRAGIHPKALEYVLRFNVKDIIYVSCNPKTLVQDLKVMIENGYVVEKVKLMDMFPHTPHCETVVKLQKKLV
jgi:23S rRNA (uracil1939-C5)-methyltransferase